MRLKVVTRAQMRKIETMATEEIGIPTILMMENAAIRIMDSCLAFLGARPEPKVMIVAGSGSNGGDGLALARHLTLRGVDVGVIFVGDSTASHGDALVNLEITRKLGISIQTIPMGDNLLDMPYTIGSCDLVVDALLGTGLDRKVEGSFEYIIEMMNDYAKHVIAVDIPSGIHADTGQVMGIAVKADETVTLGAPKIGILIYPGAEYAGKVTVADISVPLALLDNADVSTDILSEAEIPSMLPIRKARTNKGSFGRIFAFAGSAAMPGAAAISCAAAYRTGAGLVYACVPPSVAAVIHNAVNEVVTCLLPERNSAQTRKSLDDILEKITERDMIFVGPGLGRSPAVTEFVSVLLERAESRVVIDADGLNAIAENVGILKRMKHPAIITPHPGEMSRITGYPIEEILENTIRTAKEFACEFEAVTVLKDARTIVASPSGHTYINTTGCNALAKGGTGDALTGIITAFAAQGMESFSAAMLGTYIHGKAGELAAQTLSPYGVLASDVVNRIPDVLAKYSGGAL